MGREWAKALKCHRNSPNGVVYSCRHPILTHTYFFRAWSLTNIATGTARMPTNGINKMKASPLKGAVRSWATILLPPVELFCHASRTPDKRCIRIGLSQTVVCSKCQTLPSRAGTMLSPSCSPWPGTWLLLEEDIYISSSTFPLLDLTPFPATLRSGSCSSTSAFSLVNIDGNV